MYVNLKIEPSAKAWAWRILFGPAMLLDGLISTLSLGTLSAGTALNVARRRALARFAAAKEKNHG